MDFGFCGNKILDAHELQFLYYKTELWTTVFVCGIVG